MTVVISSSVGPYSGAVPTRSEARDLFPSVTGKDWVLTGRINSAISADDFIDPVRPTRPGNPDCHRLAVWPNDKITGPQLLDRPLAFRAVYQRPRDEAILITQVRKYDLHVSRDNVAAFAQPRDALDMPRGFEGGEDVCHAGKRQPGPTLTRAIFVTAASISRQRLAPTKPCHRTSRRHRLRWTA